MGHQFACGNQIETDNVTLDLPGNIQSPVVITNMTSGNDRETDKNISKRNEKESVLAGNATDDETAPDSTVAEHICSIVLHLLTDTEIEQYLWKSDLFEEDSHSPEMCSYLERNHSGYGMPVKPRVGPKKGNHCSVLHKFD